MITPLRRFVPVLATVVALVLAAGAGSGYADTVPTDPNDPRTPTTVSADALPTVQIDGVVWQQTTIGNTVYAAGSFSTARPAGSAAGTNEVHRSNLLAFDVVTGALKTDFVADLDAQAKTVTASPDGTRLYVGGDFTTVNGFAHQRVAALDPTTGDPVPGFTAGANGQVSALVASADTVYLGGAFSTVNGHTAVRLGAVAASTGAFLPAFRASAAGGSVQALALAPDASKLVVGGSFTTLDGSGDPGYGLGAVNPATGDLLDFHANHVVRDAGANAAILTLTADATNVYGSGYVYGDGGNLEGTFAAGWDDTDLTWLEDCHGDSYGIYAASTAVYVGSHAHYCSSVHGFPETSPRSYHYATAFSLAATQTVSTTHFGDYANFGGQPAPSPLDWYPDLVPGTYTGKNQAAWSVTGTGPYVVYGGEFTKVNGTKQQGLVRFATTDVAPDLQGPRLTAAAFTPTLTAPSPGTVVVSWPSNWDRDNQNLTYTVYADGVLVKTRTAPSTFWNHPTLTYTHTGVAAGTHTYKVVVKDPSGNTVSSPAVSITTQAPAVRTRSAAPGGSPSPVPTSASTPAG